MLVYLYIKKKNKFFQLLPSSTHPDRSNASPPRCYTIRICTYLYISVRYRSHSGSQNFNKNKKLFHLNTVTNFFQLTKAKQQIPRSSSTSPRPPPTSVPLPSKFMRAVSFSTSVSLSLSLSLRRRRTNARAHATTGGRHCSHRN